MEHVSIIAGNVKYRSLVSIMRLDVQCAEQGESLMVVGKGEWVFTFDTLGRVGTRLELLLRTDHSSSSQFQ